MGQFVGLPLQVVQRHVWVVADLVEGIEEWLRSFGLGGYVDGGQRREAGPPTGHTQLL